MNRSIVLLFACVLGAVGPALAQTAPDAPVIVTAGEAEVKTGARPRVGFDQC